MADASQVNEEWVLEVRILHSDSVLTQSCLNFCCFVSSFGQIHLHYKRYFLTNVKKGLIFINTLFDYIGNAEVQYK